MTKTARAIVVGMLAAVTLLLFLIHAVQAEIERSQLYTRPVPPPREVLEPLNLVQAWRTVVPVDAQRDGIDSIQMTGTDLLVHTRAGLVAAIDAETGQTRWRTPVGVPYRSRHLLAYNSRYVFPINNTYLYCIDRRDGAIRWRYRMVGASSAPPVADEDNIYIVRPDGRIFAYYIPRLEIPWAVPIGASPGDTPSPSPEGPDAVSPLYRENMRSTGAIGIGTELRGSGSQLETGPQPEKIWSYMTAMQIQHRPVLAEDYLMVSNAQGKLVALAKRPNSSGQTVEIFAFAVDGDVSVESGYLDNTAYLGSQDTNLYAILLSSGKVMWRYTSGSPIIKAPFVTADDVFMTASGQGLFRLRRSTGEPLWRVPLYQGRGRRSVAESNAEADQILATNPKFTYALDSVGRLLVLDSRRGVTLARLDTRAYVVPVANEYTDRVYLAANNGLVICLRDREYLDPIRNRPPVETGSRVIREKLDEPVTAPAIEKPLALRDVLEGYRGTYGLRFFIDLRAFKEAGIDNPEGKAILVPKAQNTPLSDLLKQVLAQAGATFKVVDDFILILPARKKAE